jgi:hypothetical protein
MSEKQPYFPFYVGDWSKDADLRRCSKAAKGVWIDMLCLMHECQERGVFSTGGVPWSDEDIAAAVGGDIAENLKCLRELIDKGVARRNQSGAVFSLRVVRDEEKRQKCSEAGKKGGGNPEFKGRSKGGRKGRAKVAPKVPPNPSSVSNAVAVSDSEAETKATAKDAVADAPGGSNLTVIHPRKLQPHQEFVERFKIAYSSLNPGHTYDDKKTDYILAADLIKEHGMDLCVVKAKTLGVMCKRKAGFFTKAGGADFTIGTLKQWWNKIVPDSVQPTQDEDLMSELKKQEALRAGSGAN